MHVPETNPKDTMPTPNLYETDFYAWTQEQASLLRKHQWSQLDLLNLIEEIESLGKQQRQELRNRLTLLIGHLLKWEYQPQRRSRSWLATIRVQRRDTLRLLQENPSLKSYLEDALLEAYENGRDLAMGETDLPEQTFPKKCPYRLTEILGDRFYPGDASELISESEQILDSVNLTYKLLSRFGCVAVYTMTQSQDIPVSLDMIRTDSNIVSREQENPNIIQRFAKVMQDDSNYPSIICFVDGEYYKLIYGLNLLKAAREAGLDNILVDVHPNPSNERRNVEKERTVKKMLSLLEDMGDEEKIKQPNTAIAEVCGVSEWTIRNKIKEFGYKAPNQIVRATHTGKLSIVETSNIGSQSKLRKKGFDWAAIDDKQFEELVYEIVKAHHPVKIEDRSGTGGKGRDIEAKFRIKGGLDEEREELYFIEAKHFTKRGVNWVDISDAFKWAEDKKPSVLVIATSFHLTNPCKDEIFDWEKKHPNIHVIRWERRQIQSLVLSKPSVKNLAVKFRLIPKYM